MNCFTVFREPMNTNDPKKYNVCVITAAKKIVFSDSGVTGLAYPGTVEVASNHGVYIVPQTQSGENLRKVVDFLQKPTYDELEKCSLPLRFALLRGTKQSGSPPTTSSYGNGLDTTSRAFIDTGVMKNRLTVFLY